MNLNLFVLLTSALTLLAVSGCSALNEKSSHLHTFHPAPTPSQLGEAKTEAWSLEKPPSLSEIKEVVKTDQVDQKVKELGEWWLYGPGMGRTVLNIGTMVVFPPYALYLLTNAGLAMAGEPQLSIFEALPDEPREIAESTYDSITKVPGRLTSLATGKKFYGEKE